MRVRQEITVWDKVTEYRVPQHIYLTEGTNLVGYIPEGKKTAVMFSTPKKQWSVSRRKFREITSKTELAMYEF